MVSLGLIDGHGRFDEQCIDDRRGPKNRWPKLVECDCHRFGDSNRTARRARLLSLVNCPSLIRHNNLEHRAGSRPLSNIRLDGGDFRWPSQTGGCDCYNRFHSSRTGSRDLARAKFGRELASLLSPSRVG